MSKLQKEFERTKEMIGYSTLSIICLISLNNTETMLIKIGFSIPFCLFTLLVLAHLWSGDSK